MDRSEHPRILESRVKRFKLVELQAILHLYRRYCLIGLAHGCFDLLHYGHIRHLQYAKGCCDILVVTITADQWVRKGIGRPIWDQEKRLAVLAALEAVDFVAEVFGYSGLPALRAIQPTLYFKGPDREHKPKGKYGEEELSYLEGQGGTVVYTPTPEFHSSDVISKLKA